MLVLALLAGCGGAPASDPFTKTGELIALSGGDAGAANACFTCHGLDGRGDGAGAPRLAALEIGYLNRQLDDYALGRRRHAPMQEIAKRLSAEGRQQVSAYYAAMRFDAVPAAVPPSPLYTEGDPTRGLAPCATCHGRAGEGAGPGNPALGGQPELYLAEQMRLWQRGERRNDPDNLMQRIAAKLSEAEIRSVAAHASALPGVRPAPLE